MDYYNISIYNRNTSNVKILKIKKIKKMKFIKIQNQNSKSKKNKIISWKKKINSKYILVK